jgi:putative SOS response-associated peptidase YedK
MCGRYYRKSDKQKIAEAFHATMVDDFPLPPSDYNVAPTTMQPIVRANRDTGERELVQLRWGLIPFFTKQISDVMGISTINARAETVAKSHTYREPFKKRRCIVPASGFYEWKKLDAKDEAALWLRSGQRQNAGVRRPQPPIDLLRPFPADEVEAFEVSKDVGNVKNNSQELLNSK